MISILTVVADDPSPTGVESASDPPALTRSSSTRAQGSARRATHVVDAALQTVELFDDGQRDDDVDADETGDARRVGDEHRGVEHHPSSHTSLDIDFTSMGRDEIGQRNSYRRFGLTSELSNALVVAEGARAMVDSARYLVLTPHPSYMAGGTPSSSCTPQLLRANETTW